MIQLIVIGLLNFLYAQYANSQATEVVMAKVTIVVDGMMKSKSGAT
ncbi:MAG: hypothetical protein O7F71_12475 [Gammaproteobacteria bacterium]|nr:hypothetical protein [Gammaproteobacteria bacterium]